MGAPASFTPLNVERRQIFRVDAEAWRDRDIAWNSEDLIELSAAAARCESMPEVLRISIGRLLPVERIRSWVVITVDPDGSVRRNSHVAADVGLSARAIAWLWDSGVMADAFREGAAYVEAWQAADGAEAIACLPLVRGGVVRSLIAVWLVSDRTETILSDVARLTLLGRLCVDSPAESVDVDFTEASELHAGSDLVELTSRQHVILRAMARGLTNAQIARQISFSESTVRLESMSIYRHFGVHSRVEAVQAARAAGELDAKEVVLLPVVDIPSDDTGRP